MSQASLFRRIIYRYLIEGLSGMAPGLFLTLIIGLTINQIVAGLGVVLAERGALIFIQLLWEMVLLYVTGKFISTIYKPLFD